MLAGREIKGIRYGQYFVAGASVTVADPFGTWAGQIQNISLDPSGETTVTVTDPGANPHRKVGERLERHWTELRLVSQ